MTFALRPIVLILLFGLLGVPVSAQEIVIGTGPICDTQQQTERLIALIDAGADSAIKVVNVEENNPTACVVATVAYLRGPKLAKIRSKDGTYQIVKVLVVGLQTPGGIVVTAPAAYFTIVKVNEQDV